MLYQPAHRSFWRRHPVVTGVSLAIASWWVANGWYEVVAVAAITALLLVLNRRRRALAIRVAGLRARADYEHRLSLAGDPRGVFGRYPPLQAGWFADPQSPQNRCRVRYFDGAVWTQHTA